MVHHDGQAGPGQRRDDHGQFGACRRIAVSAAAAHDIAVAVGVHIHIEIGVDLGGAQDDHIQAVHRAAAHGLGLA